MEGREARGVRRQRGDKSGRKSKAVKNRGKILAEEVHDGRGE